MSIWPQPLWERARYRVYGVSYRIVSERMKAEYDEVGVHQFDVWVRDI